MQTLLAQFSPVLLLVGVALFLLTLRNVIRQFNQSRRAPYYILREEAARSAGRWAIVCVVAVVATLALALYTSQAPPPPVEPTATATAPVPTLGAPPTRTATPTRTPAPSATPTVSASPTPAATLAPDAPAALLTPIPGAATPNPAAAFEFLTLASRIDASFNPIDPGLQFPAGTSRVYVIFRATGVNNGAPWGVFCYRDGAIFDLFVGLWDDGPNRQTSRAFCSHDGSPGAYTLRAYLGANLAFEIRYSLAGAPAPAATPAPPEATPEASPTTAP
jgi:hypothetical protein